MKRIRLWEILRAMPETILLVIIFLVFTMFRELVNYRQVSRLQELLKSADITEYYQANRSDKKSIFGRRVERSENEVMEEENSISIDDPEFDLSKIEKVNIDGEERPITIV